MILLAEFEAKSYVFLLLMLGVIGWLLFRIARRTKHKDPLRPVPRMTNTARSLGTAPPPEFDRWSVEMQDLARDMLAQIDTKMRALDYLTTQATAATERLEAATQRVPADPTTRERGSHTTPESPDTHNQADVLEREMGRTHQDETSKDVADDDIEPRRRAIFELADQGTDVAAIAAEVGSPVGEIELILGLRGPGGLKGQGI